MAWSTDLVLCCGASHDEVARRAQAIGRDPSDLRASGAAGTVAEVTDKLAGFAAAGCDRMYLQVLDLDDVDHLRLVAAEVAPALGT